MRKNQVQLNNISILFDYIRRPKSSDIVSKTSIRNEITDDFPYDIWYMILENMDIEQMKNFVETNKQNKEIFYNYVRDKLKYDMDSYGINYQNINGVKIANEKNVYDYDENDLYYLLLKKDNKDLPRIYSDYKYIISIYVNVYTRYYVTYFDHMSKVSDIFLKNLEFYPVDIFEFVRKHNIENILFYLSLFYDRIIKYSKWGLYGDRYNFVIKLLKNTNMNLGNVNKSDTKQNVEFSTDKDFFDIVLSIFSINNGKYNYSKIDKLYYGFKENRYLNYIKEDEFHEYFLRIISQKYKLILKENSNNFIGAIKHYLSVIPIERYDLRLELFRNIIAKNLTVLFSTSLKNFINNGIKEYDIYSLLIKYMDLESINYILDYDKLKLILNEYKNSIESNKQIENVMVTKSQYNNFIKEIIRISGKSELNTYFINKTIKSSNKQYFDFDYKSYGNDEKLIEGLKKVLEKSEFDYETNDLYYLLFRKNLKETKRILKEYLNFNGNVGNDLMDIFMAYYNKNKGNMIFVIDVFPSLFSIIEDNFTDKFNTIFSFDVKSILSDLSVLYPKITKFYDYDKTIINIIYQIYSNFNKWENEIDDYITLMICVIHIRDTNYDPKNIQILYDNLNKNTGNIIEKSDIFNYIIHILECTVSVTFIQNDFSFIQTDFPLDGGLIRRKIKQYIIEYYLKKSNKYLIYDFLDYALNYTDFFDYSNVLKLNIITEINATVFIIKYKNFKEWVRIYDKEKNYGIYILEQIRNKIINKEKIDDFIILKEVFNNFIHYFNKYIDNDLNYRVLQESLNNFKILS